MRRAKATPAPDAVSVTITVNGALHTLPVRPAQTLLDLLRDTLGLTGTNRGCNQGDCGACTVQLDGVAVNACLVLAVDADGADVVTIEGLAQGGVLHPVQRAFVDEGAVQCGYCTPGMVMQTVDLLRRNPTPDDAAIRAGIEGNLCRCTGYAKIARAVASAAKAMAATAPPAPARGRRAKAPARKPARTAGAKGRRS